MRYTIWLLDQHLDRSIDMQHPPPPMHILSRNAFLSFRSRAYSLRRTFARYIQIYYIYIHLIHPYRVRVCMCMFVDCSVDSLCYLSESTALSDRMSAAAITHFESHIEGNNIYLLIYT